MVDDLDLRIIGALQVDGRRSILDISRELGEPRSTVKRRLDNLIRNRVIMVTAYVDSAKLGLPIHVHLNMRIAMESYAEALAEIVKLTEIRWIAATTGPADIVAEGFFASPDHLHDFIKNRLSAINGIRSVETSLILSLEKFTFHWDEIRAAADQYVPAHIPLGTRADNQRRRPEKKMTEMLDDT
jgi:Lrp/AsnC family transcriptional regulator, regulator for asnA, asnC and gidA